MNSFNDAPNYTHLSTEPSISSEKYLTPSSIATIAEKEALNLDLVVLSHLRWDFVFQRPQHLLTRFARHNHVVYMEEPIWQDNTAEPRLDVSYKLDGRVHVLVPHLPGGRSGEQDQAEQAQMLANYINNNNISEYALWLYTPMALPIAAPLERKLLVFDCMDELSAFKGASPELLAMETRLMQEADVVFTGGQSLYEAKKHRHSNIHAFPSSIDQAHFAQAKNIKADPTDQAGIPHPRIGFYGVVDERFDIELLREAAALKPEWHHIILGPVVKIDPDTLPQANNIHYLGGKSYDELPHYLAGWDVATLPFALNESTRFISPTKTPEYLAAGKPVVSTPITDVVEPYGNLGLVHIAETPAQYVASIENALLQTNDSAWRANVDTFLEKNSWDKTWQQMTQIMLKTLNSHK